MSEFSTFFHLKEERNYSAINYKVLFVVQHKELQIIADQRKETHLDKQRREEERILKVRRKFFKKYIYKVLVLV